MSDGSVYVVASYALTTLVLVGYAARLVLRGRRVRRRHEALAASPPSREGGEGDAVRPPARELTHV